MSTGGYTTARSTLPERVAAAYPDGPPPDLVPVRLVPIEVFGGDCRCHLEHDHDGNPCNGWGYGLVDAVPGYSDCNRAHGRIYRRDEDESPRGIDEVIVVWVAPDEASKFERVLGDGNKPITHRVVTEEFLRGLIGALRIEELGLEARPYNQLLARNYRYIGDVLELTESTLYSMRNMGVKSVENIKERLLAEYGLMLATDPEQHGPGVE